MTSPKTKSPYYNPESFNNQRYNDYFDPNTLRRLKMIASLVGENQKVLDLACGSGELMTLLRQQNNHVVGIEISQAAASEAQKKGFNITTADLEKPLPFKEASFDIITAGEIIEHLYDTDYFLTQIHGLLKPNGYLVLSTPNLASLGRRLLLLTGKNPLTETHLSKDSAGHIRYFVKESLFTLLASNGFKVIHYTSDSINFTNSNLFSFPILGKLFPQLGGSIIVKAQKL